jgi:hypothetical protein
MLKRRITNPWDLTELDQWVNDATRADIENLLKENPNIFGLKVWEWVKIREKALIGSLNFSVDMIFKNEDEAKVDALTHHYDITKNGWSSRLATEVIEKLSELSLMHCIWV